MTKQKLDTFNWEAGTGTKKSPDGKHIAKFSRIREFAMGADWFELTIDDIHLGDFYTYHFGWTPDSRYFITPQYVDLRNNLSVVIIIDIHKQRRAKIAFNKLVFMKSIEENLFTVFFATWGGHRTAEQSFRIDEISDWQDLSPSD